MNLRYIFFGKPSRYILRGSRLNNKCQVKREGESQGVFVHSARKGTINKMKAVAKASVRALLRSVLIFVDAMSLVFPSLFFPLWPHHARKIVKHEDICINANTGLCASNASNAATYLHFSFIHT